MKNQAELLRKEVHTKNQLKIEQLINSEIEAARKKRAAPIISNVAFLEGELDEENQLQDIEESEINESFTDSASMISGKSGASPLLKLKHAKTDEPKKSSDSLLSS